MKKDEWANIAASRFRLERLNSESTVKDCPNIIRYPRTVGYSPKAIFVI